MLSRRILALAILPLVVSTATAQSPHWTGDTTIGGAVTIPAGDTIVVDPGAHVAGQGTVTVLGTLKIHGTSDAPVTWTPRIDVLEGGHLIVDNGTFRSTYTNDCAITVAGRAEIRASEFAHTSKALCLDARATTLVVGSSFHEDGFPHFESPPPAATICSPGGCSATHAIACEQDEGGYLCRGGGGSAAILVDPNSTTRIERSMFDDNNEGIGTALADLEVVGSTFRHSASAGIEVNAYTHEDPARVHEYPPGLVRIHDNSFEWNGDPNATATLSPGMTAGIRVILGQWNDVHPDGSLTLVTIADNVIDHNAIGIAAEGWYPTAAITNNSFENDSFGFRALSASAILTNNSFSNKDWDVYLYGLTGYTKFHGARPAKVYVGGGATLAADWGLVVAGGSLVGLLGAAILLLTEHGRSLLFRALSPLYSRVAKDELLSFPRREAIYGIVQANSGAHLRQIVQLADVPYTVALYHLDRLERAGYIRSRRVRSKRVYTTTGTRVELASDEEPLRDQILRLLHSQPSTQRELSTRLDSSRQLIHYHLKRLVAEGKVREEPATRKYVVTAHANVARDGVRSNA